MPDIMSDRLIPLREVKARVGLGHTAIYRKMGQGQFPQARFIGQRSVRWLESEISAWIAGLPTSRDPSGCRPEG